MNVDGHFNYRFFLNYILWQLDWECSWWLLVSLNKSLPLILLSIYLKLLFFSKRHEISHRCPSRHLQWFHLFSPNLVICYITCTYRNKLYIGETGRRQGDQFWEHLHNVERNDKDASKPVVRQKSHCNLSLHLSSSKAIRKASKQFESRKNFRTKIYLSNRQSVSLFSAYKHIHNPQFLHSLWRVTSARNVSFEALYGGQFMLLTKLIIRE